MDQSFSQHTSLRCPFSLPSPPPTDLSTLTTSLKKSSRNFEGKPISFSSHYSGSVMGKLPSSPRSPRGGCISILIAINRHPFLCDNRIQQTDKTSTGTQAIFGLLTDTKTTLKQYALLTTFFYIGYLVSEVSRNHPPPPPFFVRLTGTCSYVFFSSLLCGCCNDFTRAEGYQSTCEYLPSLFNVSQRTKLFAHLTFSSYPGYAGRPS